MGTKRLVNYISLGIVSFLNSFIITLILMAVYNVLTKQIHLEIGDFIGLTSFVMNMIEGICLIVIIALGVFFALKAYTKNKKFQKSAHWFSFFSVLTGYLIYLALVSILSPCGGDPIPACALVALLLSPIIVLFLTILGIIYSATRLS